MNFVKGSLLTVALASILTTRDDHGGSSSTRQPKSTFFAPIAHAAQEYRYQKGRATQEEIVDLEDAEYYEYDDTVIESMNSSHSSKDLSSRNRRLNENQTFQFSCSAHACLLAYDSVQCVGYNYYGQIGQSISDAFGTPVLLNFPSGIDNAKPVKVVTGYDHTCTLFDNKSVWCNGSNGFGQLGDTSSANSATPVQVKEGSTVLADAIDIEAGAYHNCAIKSTGAVYCWGFNTDWQLSLTDIMNGGTDDTKVSKMALSMTSTCVVTGSSSPSTSVTCVGFGFSSVGTTTSTTIELGSSVHKLTAGSFHFCALLDNGSAKCWGTNHAGQLGIGSSDYNPRFDSAEAVLDSSGVSPLSGIADINAGYSSTCLVLTNGNPMCFGNNQFHQLGIGNGGTGVLSPTNVPIASVSGKTLVSVYVGEQTGHAVFNDDSVYSWGTNYGGTFGDGTLVSSRNIIGSEVATEMNFRVPNPISSGWRLLASNANTVSIAWDISLIQFYPNTDCTGTPLSGGNYLSSGNGGDSTTWGPQNAFLDNDLSWGGRADGSGNFYIGMTFSSNYEVGCVALDQRAETEMATVVYVQRLTGIGWENVYIGSNLSVTGNTINHVLGWRLLASNMVSAVAWDVSLIQFFPNTDCTGTALSGGNYYSSGQDGSTAWGPQNAFLNNGLSWGGRADRSGNFYIGMTFPSNYEVGCVKLDQRAQDGMATVVYVQRLNGNGWENVYIGSNLSLTDTIDNVESYLHNLIDSAYENINVSGSNYATAFNTAKTWFTNVSNHPTLYLSGNHDPSPNKDYDGYFTDRFMLALLYYQNCSTTGCQNLLSSTSPWLGSSDHCSWLGVTECTNISKTSKDGSETYVESRVTRIGLNGKQLSGKLPYFNMSQLQYLYLYTNIGLIGTIPDFKFPNLIELKLVECSFTAIPAFQDMPNLTLLQVGNNPLTGALPQFQLASILTIGGSLCSFSSVPDLTTSCPNLQSIGITGNKANLVVNQNMCNTFGAGSFTVATGYTKTCAS